VYRAIHTLSGSSKMAEARHGIRITEPLNHVMRKVFDSGHGLSDSGLATLDQSVRAIENVLSHINESTAFSRISRHCLRGCAILSQKSTPCSPAKASDSSASATRPGPPWLRLRKRVASASGRCPWMSPPAAEEFDHEIANIYSEEATELLESAQPP